MSLWELRTSHLYLIVLEILFVKAALKFREMKTGGKRGGGFPRYMYSPGRDRLAFFPLLQDSALRGLGLLCAGQPAT